MAIEIQPSGRGILLFFGLLVVLVIGSQTSGALLTLGLLVVIVGVSLYLLYVAGVRVTRYLTGA